MYDNYNGDEIDIDSFSLSDIIQGMTSIEEQRKLNNKAVKWFQDNEVCNSYIPICARMRGLDEKTLRDADVFFVDEALNKNDLPSFIDDSTGLVNGRGLYMFGRLVYPIKDVKGDTMGFCGWDKFVTGAKYLDSKNYGYKAKEASMWGMEKLEEYYLSTEPVFFLEGIADALVLRELGCQSLAILTSMLSDYVKIIIKRFGDRAVFITDNDNFDIHTDEDTAGLKFARSIAYNFKNNKIYQPRYFKDVNDIIKSDNPVDKELLQEDLKRVNELFYNPKQLILFTRVLKRRVNDDRSNTTTTW